jgi:hypothetical protein
MQLPNAKPLYAKRETRLPSRVNSISSGKSAHLHLSRYDKPTAAAMDARSEYTVSVLSGYNESTEEPRTEIQAKLKEFVLAFQID